MDNGTFEARSGIQSISRAFALVEVIGKCPEGIGVREAGIAARDWAAA